MKLAHLRPEPPQAPESFIDALRPGAPAELHYLGGYWEVDVIKRTNAGKFQVLAERYQAKHTVAGEKLRPAWSWTEGSPYWELREK